VATCSSWFDLKTSASTQDRSCCQHSSVQSKCHRSIYRIDPFAYRPTAALIGYAAPVCVEYGLSSACQFNRILLRCVLHTTKSLGYLVLYSLFCFSMLHWKGLILRWFNHNCQSNGKRWVLTGKTLERCVKFNLVLLSMGLYFFCVAVHGSWTAVSGYCTQLRGNIGGKTRTIIIGKR
jgi:hypothetical protein